ncbi:hypothetical protein HGRIS_006559 [Hohenbuehelia grisea]|uniref:DUF7025 domain-containing protein n=1 Tax=Hohenbuehelia grisea TaxID=104357 RepID=A0ABR3J9E7_9AGAR
MPQPGFAAAQTSGAPGLQPGSNGVPIPGSVVGDLSGLLPDHPGRGLVRTLRAAGTFIEGKPCYQLTCESVDTVDPLVATHTPNELPSNTNNASGRSSNGSTSGGRVGKVQTTVIVGTFRGTVPITSLGCYPLRYHADVESVKRQLVERGKKWFALATGGPQHVQMPVMPILTDNNNKNSGTNDWPSSLPPGHNYGYDDADDAMNSQPPPVPVGNNGIQTSSTLDTDIDLTDNDLYLTPAVVHGISLSDKVWFEFNVQKIAPVD